MSWSPAGAAPLDTGICNSAATAQLKKRSRRLSYSMTVVPPDCLMEVRRPPFTARDFSLSVTGCRASKTSGPGLKDVFDHMPACAAVMREPDAHDGCPGLADQLGG